MGTLFCATVQSEGAWGSNPVPHTVFPPLPCLAAIPSSHCWRASPHYGSSHWAASASAARAEHCAHDPDWCKCKNWLVQRTCLQMLSACEQSIKKFHVTARRWTRNDNRFGRMVQILVIHHVLPWLSDFQRHCRSHHHVCRAADSDNLWRQMPGHNF